MIALMFSTTWTRMIKILKPRGKTERDVPWPCLINITIAYLVNTPNDSQRKRNEATWRTIFAIDNVMVGSRHWKGNTVSQAPSLEPHDFERKG